jgi:murein DD-endopeptidase MepM/ murein hydrolase activator NlpD
VSEGQQQPARGYGNIYTPHAGSMIIQVQRESGLANRTIVLNERQVRMLRLVASRRGVILMSLVAVTWIFFAVQSMRVPLLTQRIVSMEQDARRLDTLQLALGQLQQRYEQVTTMLGVAATPTTQPRVVAPTPATPAAGTPTALASSAAGAVAAARVDTTATTTLQWPLAERGFITRGITGPTRYSEAHSGLDVALPVGTQIRAAGAGLVVEVGENAEYGMFVRLQHDGGLETLYAHNSRIEVPSGARVPAGQVIALSGNTGRSTAPHLHFEVRRGGNAVDPLQLIKR